MHVEVVKRHLSMSMLFYFYFYFHPAGFLFFVLYSCEAIAENRE